MKTINIKLEDEIYEELSEMLNVMGQTKQTFYESFTRACLKIALCQPCVTICERFVPHEGAVAGYSNRIRGKSAAKWGVWVA